MSTGDSNGDGIAVHVPLDPPILTLAPHPARRWEPKRLRLRLFTLAGRLARTGHRVILHLSAQSPWTTLATQAITTLRALPTPS